MNTITQETRNLDITEIRARVGELLNRLSTRLIRDMTASDPATHELPLQQAIARLGQIAAGLAIVDEECLPANGAGYASTVTVRDLDSGQKNEYVLMVGSLVDIEANQVSLASPIGQALLGRSPGERTSFSAPTRRVRLQILSVTTLAEFLAELELRHV
jgi:transcription elongation GreA/GreB family factor